MLLTITEWFYLIIYAVVTAYQIYNRMEAKSETWYVAIMQKISIIVSNWAYSMLWITAYVLVAFSAFFYTIGLRRDGVDGSTMFDLFIILYLVNVFSTKFFFLFFFGQRAFGYSLALIAGTFGTAVAIMVVFILEKTWVSFGLWMPYVVFLTYQTVVALKVWQLPPISVSTR